MSKCFLGVSIRLVVSKAYNQCFIIKTLWMKWKADLDQLSLILDIEVNADIENSGEIEKRTNKIFKLQYHNLPGATQAQFFFWNNPRKTDWKTNHYWLNRIILKFWKKIQKYKNC